MGVRNWTPLLLVPFPGVTKSGPVEAPVGTVVMICESVHEETTAEVPLNITVPALDPKLLPLMVTEVPAWP